MEFITEAVGMKKFSHQYFRLCILAFDPAHIVAPRFLVMHISHYVKLASLADDRLKINTRKAKFLTADKPNIVAGTNNS